MTCPVCCEPRTVRVANMEDGARQVLRCARCLFEIVEPPIKQDVSSSSAITSPDYIRTLKTRHEQLQSLIAVRSRNRIRERSRILGRTPRRILDLGCGAGWMVNEYRMATSTPWDWSLTKAW
jgi:hypothetical protein